MAGVTSSAPGLATVGLITHHEPEAGQSLLLTLSWPLHDSGISSLQLLIQDTMYCPRFCISQQLLAYAADAAVHGPHAE